jgi:hypothetical protein
MWIVMTASAKMPNRRFGVYRLIALVEVAAHGVVPSRIDRRDKAILRVVELGDYWVGKTPRCAYQRILREAGRRVEDLNKAMPATLVGDLLVSFGSALVRAAAVGIVALAVFALPAPAALAQALPYANPRDQNCAPGYRSSGGYCAPIDERSAPAIPRVGQAQCPSGWTSSSHSCVKIESPRERERRMGR